MPKYKNSPSLSISCLDCDQPYDAIAEESHRNCSDDLVRLNFLLWCDIFPIHVDKTIGMQRLFRFLQIGERWTNCIVCNSPWTPTMRHFGCELYSGLKFDQTPASVFEDNLHNYRMINDNNHTY